MLASQKTWARQLFICSYDFDVNTHAVITIASCLPSIVEYAILPMNCRATRSAASLPHERPRVRDRAVHLRAAEVEAGVLLLEALEQHAALYVLRRGRIQLAVALKHGRPRGSLPHLLEAQGEHAVVCGACPESSE